MRCEMIKLLDPKNDLVFQKLFGMKKHKHILIGFLNAVLRLDGLDKIKDVSFEEKQLDVTLLTSEKLSILDLYVVTETSININVEIQLINQYNMIRGLYFIYQK